MDYVDPFPQVPSWMTFSKLVTIIITRVLSVVLRSIANKEHETPNVSDAVPDICYDAEKPLYLMEGESNYLPIQSEKDRNPYSIIILAIDLNQIHI